MAPTARHLSGVRTRETSRWEGRPLRTTDVLVRRTASKTRHNQGRKRRARQVRGAGNAQRSQRTLRFPVARQNLPELYPQTLHRRRRGQTFRDELVWESRAATGHAAVEEPSRRLSNPRLRFMGTSQPIEHPRPSLDGTAFRRLPIPPKPSSQMSLSPLIPAESARQPFDPLPGVHLRIFSCGTLAA